MPPYHLVQRLPDLLKFFFTAAAAHLYGLLSLLPVEAVPARPVMDANELEDTRHFEDVCERREIHGAQ